MRDEEKGAGTNKVGSGAFLEWELLRGKRRKIFWGGNLGGDSAFRGQKGNRRLRREFYGFKKRRLSREGLGMERPMKKERNGDERGRETRTKRKGEKGGPLSGPRIKKNRKGGRG